MDVHAFEYVFSYQILLDSDVYGQPPLTQNDHVQCLIVGAYLLSGYYVFNVRFQSLIQSFDLTPETAESGDPCASEFSSGESTDVPIDNILPTEAPEPTYPVPDIELPSEGPEFGSPVTEEPEFVFSTEKEEKEYESTKLPVIIPVV